MIPKLQIMKATAPNNQAVYYLGWNKAGNNYYRRYADQANLLSDLSVMDTDYSYWEISGVPIEQVPGYLTRGNISIQAADKVEAVLEFYRTIPFDSSNGIVTNAVIAHLTRKILYILDPDAGINIFVNAFFNQ